jgi:hypothetical protein
MLSISSGLRAQCNSSWNQAWLQQPQSHQPALTPPVRSLPRLLQPSSPRRLGGQYPRRWPLRQMQRSPTRRLPSPNKRELDPVAENKSRSLMPLIPMAQVRVYLPVTGCRGLGIMC